MVSLSFIFLFFFFNDTATTEIYTLSLHDALPICFRRYDSTSSGLMSRSLQIANAAFRCLTARSEEHTSELQSLTNLVCRLLLEKKKNDTIIGIYYHASKNTLYDIPTSTHNHRHRE